MPWLGSPGSPQLLWGTAGLGALPSVLGMGPRVPHASAPAAVALTRLWDRTAVWWVLTTQTQGFPLPFLVFLAVSLDLHPGAAAG